MMSSCTAVPSGVSSDQARADHVGLLRHNVLRIESGHIADADQFRPTQATDERATQCPTSERPSRRSHQRNPEAPAGPGTLALSLRRHILTTGGAPSRLAPTSIVITPVIAPVADSAVSPIATTWANTVA